MDLKNTLSPAFWAEGPARLLDGLRKEERAALAPIEEELKQTVSPARKTYLETVLETLKVRFRRQRVAVHKDVERSLF